MQNSTKGVIGLATLLVFLHSQVHGAVQVLKAEVKNTGFIDLRVRGAKASTPVIWQENRTLPARVFDFRLIPSFC